MIFWIKKIDQYYKCFSIIDNNWRLTIIKSVVEKNRFSFFLYYYNKLGIFLYIIQLCIQLCKK